jgi:hypothetical protein
MQANLILSKNYIINDYFRFINFLFIENKKILFSLRTSIKLKLVKKKLIFRFYKKLLRLNVINNILHSHILLSYFALKQFLLNVFSETTNTFLTINGIMLFSYHFLLLYKAIFLLRMMLDWFPIKNWERSSPLKRFLMRCTTTWTKPFENYFPPIFAWIIVINILPMFISLIETSFVLRDLRNFPVSYSFEELITFVHESNLRTLK